jgi:glyoxylase-like metal-dependent hydrolase (beta-lactamase superfamily II)/rhodanese-related sulfurtransferase
MQIEQIYTGCLAQGAYYITSEGEAAIIDPLREVKPYLERLERDGAKLKYIFETHFHADFVSGHIDLSRQTGASIVYGPSATPEFDVVCAVDGQEFQIGKVTIKVIHTPGHTLESSCYLLFDETGHEHALFSGDTLFLGDVGRPDLAQKIGKITKEDLAGMLYDSLYEKILPLSDDLIVYPAHGAGSACGKNMMKQTTDTLGNQKKLNYALNQPDKEHFVEAVLEGLTAPPKYFGMNVEMNKSGYSNINEVIKTGMQALSPTDFEALADESGALILDTRNAGEFAKCFVPQSINIGLNGEFAPWVGALIADVRQPILLVTAAGREEESVIRLSRVGFDNTLGYLKGGIEAWSEAGMETDSVTRIPAASFDTLDAAEVTSIIDIRRESEYEAGHLDYSVNLPLDYINDWIHTIDNDTPYFIHCAGGYRSMIGASILKARGFHNIVDVEGGYNGVIKSRVNNNAQA